MSPDRNVRMHVSNSGLCFATALLDNQTIYDLDGSNDTSTDYRYLVVEKQPLIKHSDTGAEEKMWPLDKIDSAYEQLLAQEPDDIYADIYIVARTNRLGAEYAKFLQYNGAPTHTVSR